MRIETWSEMKERVVRGIAASPLIGGCLVGDKKYIAALLKGYWVFVDGFPEVIHNTYSDKMLSENLLRDVLKRMGRNPDIGGRLVQKFRRQFAGMQADETAHRTLWLQCANAIGLSREDLQGAEVPATREILRTVAAEPKLFKRYAFFAAVEIVAEGISRILLQSSYFQCAVTRGGLRWFQKHAEHDDGTIHEEIARKAMVMFSVGNAPAISQGFAAIVGGYADLFIDAGVACCHQLVDASHVA